MFLISSLQLLWTKQIAIDYTQDVKKLLGKPFLTDTFYFKIQERKNSQDIIVNNIFECLENDSSTNINLSDVIDSIIEKHIGSEERNLP